MNKLTDCIYRLYFHSLYSYSSGNPSAGCGICVLYQLQDTKHYIQLCMTASKGHHEQKHF